MSDREIHKPSQPYYEQNLVLENNYYRLTKAYKNKLINT